MDKIYLRRLGFFFAMYCCFLYTIFISEVLINFRSKPGRTLQIQQAELCAMQISSTRFTVSQNPPVWAEQTCSSCLTALMSFFIYFYILLCQTFSSVFCFLQALIFFFSLLSVPLCFSIPLFWLLLSGSPCFIILYENKVHSYLLLIQPHQL